MPGQTCVDIFVGGSVRYSNTKCEPDRPRVRSASRGRAPRKIQFQAVAAREWRKCACKVLVVLIFSRRVDASRDSVNNRDKVLFKQTMAKKVDVIPNLDVSFWIKTFFPKVG